MKIRYIFLLVLLVIAGTLFYTNPDEIAHKAFIKEKFTIIFNEKVESELDKLEDKNLKIFGNLGKSLFPVFGDNLLEQILDTRVRQKNYYLFSLTQVLYKDQWNSIGIGILGRMYLFPKVEEELQNIDIKEEALKFIK